MKVLLELISNEDKVRGNSTEGSVTEGDRRKIQTEQNQRAQDLHILSI